MVEIVDQVKYILKNLKNHNIMLEDLDPMPFGKYKDTEMQDVPARYLFWYWSETDRFHPEVNEYIRTNLNSLKQEYPNGIWDDY